MGSEDVTLDQSKPTAAAAGQAALGALVAGAINASKSGGQSSELKVTIVGIAASALVAGLHIFAVVPGPWMVPALIAIAGISVGSAAYAHSRGNVKAAALNAASAVVMATNFAHPAPDQADQAPTGA